MTTVPASSVAAPAGAALPVPVPSGAGRAHRWRLLVPPLVLLLLLLAVALASPAAARPTPPDPPWAGTPAGTIAAGTALPLPHVPAALPPPGPAPRYRRHAAAGPAAAGAAAAAGVPPDRAGVWPVAPAVVVREFDPPERRWLPGHRGLDLAAAEGDPVVSAAAGVVAFAAVIAGRGVVVVSHGALRATYEPVAAEVDVGEQVDRGAVLGRIAPGSGHCDAAEPCLHWGLRRGEDYLDPRLLLGLVRPVLLPLRR